LTASEQIGGIHSLAHESREHNLRYEKFPRSF
jgi:hypothetical protein